MKAVNLLNSFEDTTFWDLTSSESHLKLSICVIDATIKSDKIPKCVSERFVLVFMLLKLATSSSLHEKKLQEVFTSYDKVKRCSGILFRYFKSHGITIDFCQS